MDDSVIRNMIGINYLGRWWMSTKEKYLEEKQGQPPRFLLAGHIPQRLVLMSVNQQPLNNPNQGLSTCERVHGIFPLP